jgi:hypothetical protein
MSGPYETTSDEQLVAMVRSELQLHMMNDTAAMDKVRELVDRFSRSHVTIRNADKYLREENKRLAKENKSLTTKLKKVKSILIDC